MTLTARFDTFHASTDGKDIVYGGRTADGGKVEIRQPVADVDVMVVLLATVLEKSLQARPTSARSHPVDSLTVESGPDGGALVSFVSHELARVFQLTPQLAAQLSTNLAEITRRSHLRSVT